ncbi:hypothetical protein IP65_17870 [Novosphingobium sp. AAP1]|uniref:hypothetical protein n=1 Tax=Novosphingobium sp. AAP1 TaxID=1523413 RepID=UPI0006B9C0FA|nr:hypothetical protein [Novosphingobium sp. AAP1]KPF52063.1 hypothetical protein IP65_17870 [Novosphingobium sp. AAP1]
MTCYLFDQKSLPEGFQFPQSFLDVVGRDVLPDLQPWRFLCQSPKDADGWMLAVQRLYPTRKLVPFALWVGSDDVACFDGGGASDDPVVHYVHAYASAGWEDRGNVPNFGEWLKAATEQSASFKAQVDDQ